MIFESSRMTPDDEFEHLIYWISSHLGGGFKHF